MSNCGPYWWNVCEQGETANAHALAKSVAFYAPWDDAVLSGIAVLAVAAIMVALWTAIGLLGW